MESRNEQEGPANIVEPAGGAQGAAGPDPVVVATTVEVLCDEYEQVWPGQGRPSGEQDYRDRVRQHGQSALCLSGGGIRSASFALGVLQALSRKGLLTRFHYLSTVSGGGYIGGWLQRWIAAKGGRADLVMAALAADCEPPEVKALRENSNFITPRVGLASNDTWTAIATSLRNITVNWLLFAPLFLLVTIFPNIVSSLVEWISHGGGNAVYLVHGAQVGGAVCAAVAAWSMCRGLPSYRLQSMRVASAGDLWLKHRIVWWLIAWAVFGTLSLAGELLPAKARVPSWFEWEGARFAAASSAGMVLGLLASGLTLPGKPEERKRYRTTFIGDLWLWMSAVIAMAVMVLIAAHLFDWMRHLKVREKLSAGDWVLLTISLPVILLLAHLVGCFIVSAFRRKRVDAVKADADGEWLARLSAVQIKAMLAWLLVTFAALLLAQLFNLAVPGERLSFTSFVALVSGAIAALGGRSQRTGSGAGPQGAWVFLKYLPMRAIIALATFVFAIALFTIFATFEQYLSAQLSNPLQPMLEAAARSLPDGPLEIFDPTVAAHLLIAGVLAILLVFLGRYIPVNRFSLNGFYRNRLARAFLGAARPDRKPDYFTGFDPEDNFDLYRLAPRDESGPVLYPVVNIALNATASEKLAWQERKAAPFIFSPLYCGSGMLAPEGTPPPERPGAFVRARYYCGSEPGVNRPDRGISLAMAMSISGAAASPNMGYHSSPAIAFLMTLSNVRLGAWLPNPARAKTLRERVYKSNPTNAVRALLRELAGSTDDKGLDIYLSDGGHFDNLGLYEMVRRRCRYIVLSDAVADPDCSFADLGNAVRKVKIDMDVEIRFEELQISSRSKPINPQFAWALGRILYPDCLRSDGSVDEEKVGHLLYIKPSFFGVLPIDVRSYASGSESFPHESSVDQFFSESQFESYRNLGFWFLRTLGGEGKHQTIKQFFDAIEAEHATEKARRQEGEGGAARRSLLSWLGVGRSDPP